MADIKVDNVVAKDGWGACPKHLSKANCDRHCINEAWNDWYDKTRSEPATGDKPTHISAEHLGQLRQSAADTELAAARMETEQVRMSLVAAQKVIASMRADAALTQANDAYHTAVIKAQTAKEQHHVLAQQLAIQYGVDWKTTSFVPETGELIATPEDSTP